MERYLDRGLSRKDSTVTDGHLNTWQTEKPKRLANAKAQRGTERGPERTAKSALRKLQQDELAGSLRGGENVCAIQGFTCLRHRTMLSRSLEALREEVCRGKVRREAQPEKLMGRGSKSRQENTNVFMRQNRRISDQMDQGNQG